MVGFYKRRDPKYNKKALIYKRRVNSNGSSFWYDQETSKVCYCKDNGFTTIVTSNGGHSESVTTGSLETRDLYELDIAPEDRIVVQGSTYIVTAVKFVDDDMENCLTKKPSGTTYIEVRK